MKFFQIIVLIFNSLIGFSQVDLFFPINKDFDWESIEKQNQELKKQFIKNHPNEFKQYRHNTEYTPTISDLERCLHIIDFNGDGLDDIIFDGQSDAEPREIIVFINTGKSFTKIFTGYQEIHKIVFLDGKVHRLCIRDGGCCCDYTGTNKIYSVDYSVKLPKINQVSQMEYIYTLEYPSSYFDKPIKFKVLNDKYNIRFSPIIDDITEVWYCGEPEIGNSLGKIQSGSIGYALAEKADLTGRIWWYVALNPNSKIVESLYSDEKDKPNCYKLGWISSRFVKEIIE